ncbi:MULTISPECIES: AAA family ATPase [unclassified Adlercreutzia]|uniref:AAA family ATPase n=1 Tax=unclassified Adlercreutzia TaxID=2636013 RepID=UPI0013EA4386|nr:MULTISPECIES: ATP-binding protein [unclassified Adlercreutzia]
MRVTAVTVGGFRNVAKTRFELGGILGLVSPNNYGKSNVLAALDFGVSFLNASPKERQRLMGYLGGMPLNPELESDDFTFEVEFDDESLGEYRYVRYGYSFTWVRDDGSGRRVSDEWLLANSKPGGLWSSYIMRRKGKYRASHATRSQRTMRLDADQLAIDVLTAVDDIDINPVIRRVRGLRLDVAGLIEAESRYAASPLEFDADDDGVTFDSSDVAKQLFCLRERHPEGYEAFEEAVYTLFPEFEAFSVDPYEVKDEWKKRYAGLVEAGESGELPFHIRDELYRITVKSAYLNQPVDISRMSAGTKRTIWLLANTMTVSALGDQLLGVEEVETSIHPRMAGDLLNLLNEALGDTCMIVTSHSPYLVQYLKPERVYVGAPSEDGVARFRRIRADRIGGFLSAATDRGMGFGEYLYGLMSADDDDARVLMSYLED